MDPHNPQRLREPPADRFAAAQHRFNLREAAQELRREAQVHDGRHRQKTLYKHGATTLALFLFPPQARLAPHRTIGTVIIQAISGRLTVTAEGLANTLGPGEVVVLAAGVQHEVIAHDESEMLLTVQLEKRVESNAE